MTQQSFSCSHPIIIHTNWTRTTMFPFSISLGFPFLQFCPGKLLSIVPINLLLWNISTGPTDKAVELYNFSFFSHFLLLFYLCVQLKKIYWAIILVWQGRYLASAEQTLWFHEGFKHRFTEAVTAGGKLALSELSSGTEWSSPSSFPIPKLIKVADRSRDVESAIHLGWREACCLLRWCSEFDYRQRPSCNHRNGRYLTSNFHETGRCQLSLEVQRHCIFKRHHV
jgi:hypothetical protein